MQKQAASKYTHETVPTQFVEAGKTAKQIPARSPESERLSKDLKQRRFNFVGPTVAYAYMQAIGMLNDHTMDCFRYREIAREFAHAN